MSDPPSPPALGRRLLSFLKRASGLLPLSVQSRHSQSCRRAAFGSKAPFPPLPATGACRPKRDGRLAVRALPQEQETLIPLIVKPHVAPTRPDRRQVSNHAAEKGACPCQISSKFFTAALILKRGAKREQERFRSFVGRSVAGTCACCGHQRIRPGASPSARENSSRCALDPTRRGPRH